MLLHYDIIVIGGGHAGCEAAAAAANLGSSVLLITMDMAKFGQMSCNPAMGGIAKGQIVREIDALGGYSGIVTDRSTIQFRMLNCSKGPAMWSPRAQCDRTQFSIEWRIVLENTPNLDLWQDMANELIIEDNKIKGVKTTQGVSFSASSVILTNGTFLNGLMHIGRKQIVGGRASEPASTGISEQLASLGFSVDRMKTGTPPRLDGRSIDFSKLSEQQGDVNPGKFSFSDITSPVKDQRSCHIVYTNLTAHNVLRKGFKESPLFDGTIQGVGPRYCPSIEDKIRTFVGRDEHLLFLEPEGHETNEYYLNGFASSLDLNIQYEALHCIEGLENVKIFRPGYAIEYDYFQPTQLNYTLETKAISNLYFAGQINGTTGYEEAAAQGLMAGINAHLKIENKKEFVLKRDQAYIGVLIDDLVTKGVNEPYRMFTSRAEYRILLRQDNADSRLTEIGYSLGLASEERKNTFLKKKASINSLIDFVKSYSIKPDDINDFLLERKTPPIKQRMKLNNLIARPQVSFEDLYKSNSALSEFISELPDNTKEMREASEILLKYSGYIDRERVIAEKLKRLENLVIPDKFNFIELLALSTEARHKLDKIRPKTIAQASRISGISPSDINVLLVQLGR